MNDSKGGNVKDLVVDEQRAESLKEEAVFLRSWDLTLRQIWDIELLLNGAFSPLKGFLGRKDYTSVCRDMRMADGSLWPIPIMLDVSEEFASSIAEGQKIALRHPEGMVLAVMEVQDIWRPDLKEEAKLVSGTTDETHPGVFHLMHQTNPPGTAGGGCRRRHRAPAAPHL